MNEELQFQDLMADLAMIFGDDLADIAGDRDAEAYASERDEMFTRQAEEAADHIDRS